MIKYSKNIMPGTRKKYGFSSRRLAEIKLKRFIETKDTRPFKYDPEKCSIVKIPYKNE